MSSMLMYTARHLLCCRGIMHVSVARTGPCTAQAPAAAEGAPPTFTVPDTPMPEAGLPAGKQLAQQQPPPQEPPALQPLAAADAPHALVKSAYLLPEVPLQHFRADICSFKIHA